MTEFDAKEFHRKRAEEEALRAWPEAVLTDRVLRWASNARCPFDDLLAIWESLGLITAEVRAATNVARAADNQVFFAEYRAAQPSRSPDEIAEERAELLAAFGPGETVVDVITGERTQL